MARKPAIHITLDNFKLLCTKYAIGIDAEKFFADATKYAITRNSNIAIKNNLGVHADMFNMILLAERAAKKHICRAIIKQDSAYNTMVEVSMLAEQFAGAHNLSIVDGFKQYIRIGLGMMPEYAIGKFKYYNEKINTEYTRLKMLKDDKADAETTQAIALYYFSKFNISYSTSHQYDFYQIKLQVNQLNANYKEWIDYHIEALSFIKFPEPSLLWGPKALERWRLKPQSNIKNLKVIKRKEI